MSDHIQGHPRSSSSPSPAFPLPYPPHSPSSSHTGGGKPSELNSASQSSSDVPLAKQERPLAWVGHSRTHLGKFLCMPSAPQMG